MAKILVATDKPFAAIAVKGIREVVEGAGDELILLEKYGEKAKLLEAVKDVDAIIIRSDVIDAEVLDAIQSMVANTQADGFILLYSKKDCPVAAYLRSEGLLHVIVGKAAQSANQTIYIDNDNALAGEEAADYLYEMGHRRIAYFGVSNAMLFSAERKRGYQMSLLKHGITLRKEDCVEIDALNDADESSLRTLLTAPDHPTAVLVSDDILAVVLEQLCGKLGLRIPQELSIVSFNYSLFSRITSPQLTTVDVNPYQLGMEAASQTINHIENPNLLAPGELLPAGGAALGSAFSAIQCPLPGAAAQRLLSCPQSRQRKKRFILRGYFYAPKGTKECPPTCGKPR